MEEGLFFFVWLIFIDFLLYLGYCESLCIYRFWMRIKQGNRYFLQSLDGVVSFISVNYYFYQREKMGKVISRQIFNLFFRRIFGERELLKIGFGCLIRQLFVQYK